MDVSNFTLVGVCVELNEGKGYYNATLFPGIFKRLPVVMINFMPFLCTSNSGAGRYGKFSPSTPDYDFGVTVLTLD